MRYVLSPEFARPRRRQYREVRPKRAIPQRREVMERPPVKQRREIKRRKLIDNPRVEQLYRSYLENYHRNPHKRKRPLSKLGLQSWYTSRRHAYESLGYDPAKFDDSLDNLDLATVGDSFVELDSQLKTSEIVSDREKIALDIAEHRAIEKQWQAYAKAEGIAA